MTLGQCKHGIGPRTPCVKCGDRKCPHCGHVGPADEKLTSHICRECGRCWPREDGPIKVKVEFP